MRMTVRRSASAVCGWISAGRLTFEGYKKHEERLDQYRFLQLRFTSTHRMGITVTSPVAYIFYALTFLAGYTATHCSVKEAF